MLLEARKTDWHSLSLDDIERELATNLDQGLTAEEAKSRLRLHGYNELPQGKAEGTLLIFLKQFQSPLIYILVFVGVALVLLGEAVDAAIIFFVLLFNAVVGAIQEGKAQTRFGP